MVNQVVMMEVPGAGVSKRTKPASEEEYQRLCKRLESSDLFQVYRSSFQQATNVSLALLSTDQIAERVGRGSDPAFTKNLLPGLGPERSQLGTPLRLKENPFADEELEAGAATSEPKYLGIPLRFGAGIIGYLVVGDASGNERRSAYEVEQFQGSLALVAYMAEQLSRFAEELDLVKNGTEPIGILKARSYIQEHLSEPLPLAVVARVAALSESHFCRLFKEHVGLTLTEYVARHRVAWAKKELLRSSARITEIAFLVGFQSLSQFNRTFARLVGCAPTQFRGARLEGYRKLSA